MENPIERNLPEKAGRLRWQLPLQYEFQPADSDTTRTGSVSIAKLFLVKWKFSVAHNNEVAQNSCLFVCCRHWVPKWILCQGRYRGMQTDFYWLVITNSIYWIWTIFQLSECCLGKPNSSALLFDSLNCGFGGFFLSFKIDFSPLGNNIL